jgi:UDP-2-acetamido-3-amino-2,3-dideoxy-glucuronate N-acetyltransferase
VRLLSYWAHPTACIDLPVTIGEQTKIWHYSHICAGAQVGARCSLGQNVYLGGAAVVGDGCKIQNNVSIYDGVTLEDDVFVGPSAVFTNIATPRAFIVRKGQYLRTRIRRGASLGANATVVCGVTIGEYALIGAGAVVTRDVPPYGLAVGVPARRVGWACRCGMTLPDVLVCATCGARYRQQASDPAGLQPVEP